MAYPSVEILTREIIGIFAINRLISDKVYIHKGFLQHEYTYEKFLRKKVTIHDGLKFCIMLNAMVEELDKEDHKFIQEAAKHCMQLPRARMKKGLNRLFKETFYGKTISWNKIVAVLELVTAIIAHGVGHLILVNDLSEHFESTPINKYGGTINDWIEESGGWVQVGHEKKGDVAVEDTDETFSQLEQEDCCGPYSKPPKVTSHRCGECLTCEQVWCKISKSCQASFNDVDEFLIHEKQVAHADATSFLTECSCCGERKDRTQPIFGQCPEPCAKLYCTHKKCAEEFDPDINVIDLHYKTNHEKSLYSKVLQETKQPKHPSKSGGSPKIKQPNQPRESRSSQQVKKQLGRQQGSLNKRQWDKVCCSKDNKPPGGYVTIFYGKCSVCGEFWCRIDKDCGAHYDGLSSMHNHRKNHKHSNPISFIKTCSACEGAKDRSVELIGQCPAPCQRGYCTHEGCFREFPGLDFKTIKNHCIQAHKRILLKKEFKEKVKIIQQHRPYDVEAIENPEEEAEEEQNEEEDEDL